MISVFLLWLVVIALGGLALYYGAIISGLFKEPLLAQFRRYGDDTSPAPLLRFLQVSGACFFLIALLLHSRQVMGSPPPKIFPPVIFMALSGLAFAASVVVWWWPGLRYALPLWYPDVLYNTSRQERRFIGFAWLRLPPKMRWRLNGDQSAFRTWVDTVRLTVIYGAFDPDDPWDAWG